MYRFTELNKSKEKNKYLIPLIDDLFHQLIGSTVYAKLDLKSRYYQLGIRESYIPKTAFSTRYRHYEFTMMLFGLTKASFISMVMMHIAFREYLD